MYVLFVGEEIERSTDRHGICDRFHAIKYKGVVPCATNRVVTKPGKHQMPTKNGQKNWVNQE
jgi:hypothetical protein